MVQVTELGYIGLGVSDLAAWKTFARDIVGLEVVNGARDDVCHLRMDYWARRITLHADGSDDVRYLGLRVAGGAEFRAMQAQLSAADIAFEIGSESEAAERCVLELLKTNDPDGLPIEIFHGPLVRYARPFHPGRGMHGRFVTETGGAGHCLVRQRDEVAAEAFYHALGMRGGIEYKIQIGPHLLTPRFMHCGARDHTVAFGIGPQEKRLNHLMLEVDNLDDVGLTHELVRAAGIPVHITLGKHSNDHMYSFYFRTPSGWMLEYGWGGRPATHQSEYYDQDMYGHHPEQGGFGGEA